MRVVVVAPHPDDEVLGCGGALLQHVAEGHAVHVVFLTSGERSLPQLGREDAIRVREPEAEAAAAVLGVTSVTFLRQPDCEVAAHSDDIVPRLSGLLEQHTPDHVYVPHAGEEHPDHPAARETTGRALRAVGMSVGCAREYEVWTPLTAFVYVADISAVMETKLAAVDCYRSQTWFDYRRAATGLASFRGAFATRTAYAEVFGGWFETSHEEQR